MMFNKRNQPGRGGRQDIQAFPLTDQTGILAHIFVGCITGPTVGFPDGPQGNVAVDGVPVDQRLVYPGLPDFFRRQIFTGGFVF